MKKFISVAKWAATFFAILGIGLNSLAIYPLGPLVLLLAGILWTIVSIYWKEKSLIVTNMTLTLVNIIGLIMHYVLGVI